LPGDDKGKREDEYESKKTNEVVFFPGFPDLYRTIVSQFSQVKGSFKYKQFLIASIDRMPECLLATHPIAYFL